MNKPLATIFAALDYGGTVTINSVSLVGADQEALSTLFEKQTEHFFADDPDEIDFDPALKPSDDHVFVIKDYQLSLPMVEAFSDPVSAPRLRPQEIREGNLRSLIAVRKVNGSFEASFQAVDTRNILPPKKNIFVWDRETFSQLQHPGLAFSNQVCAVWKDGCLYFRSFFTARRVLHLSEYFTEASTPQVNEFLSHGILHVEDPRSTANGFNQSIRRKVSLMIHSGTLDKVEECGIRKTKDVAKRFGIDLKTVKAHGKERISFPSDSKSIMKLLRFLDNDYLTSPLTDEEYFSNSKRQLKKRSS